MPWTYPEYHWSHWNSEPCCTMSHAMIKRNYNLEIEKLPCLKLLLCRAQDRNAKALQKPYDGQDGKTARLRGCQWCERGKMKKNAERLSNSLSGNYPTTSRQWLLQKLDLVILHHLMTHMISLSYPWECSQKLCATHRFFQILHKSIKNFGCSFKVLIHIFSPPSRPIRHLLTSFWWVATSARSDELLRPAAGRFRGGSCHRGESYRWSSNGWCWIPKGLLNGTLSHPFGTHWRVLLCFYLISLYDMICLSACLPGAPWPREVGKHWKFHAIKCVMPVARAGGGTYRLRPCVRRIKNGRQHTIRLCSIYWY